MSFFVQLHLPIYFPGIFVSTVVAKMITELIRFEPEICICMEINWNSRENLYL